VRIVLVRPSDSANVGAAARAMKNMGLARLVVVEPPRWDEARAAARAVHAVDVLAARTVVATLAEAVAGAGLVVGTTGRPTAPEHDGAVPVRALAPLVVAAAATDEVAIVFGPEDHGLSNAELDRCQRVATIPTDPAYPSLNLAHAVMVVAYELRQAAGDAEPAGAPPADGPTLAPHERQEMLYARLEAGLRAVSFLHRDNAAHMMRALRHILGRAGLADHEVQILLGVARQMAWAGDRATRRGPN
jgi:TrmH family RNA methyltransferase